MLKDHTTTTEKVQVNPNYEDKIENGDLSAWEYLTTTFDNGGTTIVSERATVHHHPQRYISTLPIAESSNNEFTSRENKCRSSSASNLPEANLLFHQSYGNVLTSALGGSYGTEQQGHDHAYEMKKSWSYPIIRDQVEESNNFPIARQQEMFLSSNLTNTTNLQIAYHPNQYPVAFVGASEPFQQATGRFDYHEHCNQTNGLYMTNQTFLTSSYRNCTTGANSQERLVPIDYNSMTTECFPTIAHPINTSSESPTEKLVATRQRSIADDHLTATEYSKQKKPVMAQTRRKLNRSTALDPSKVPELFSPLELKAIQSWIDLQTKSNILPYQQYLRKKLLLPPLTSYNYFFRDERDNIVSQIRNDTDPLPSPLSEVSVAKLQDLLSQHWYNDPLRKKRQHRKKHGKIDFQRLSKVIAERWHQLPQRVREFYGVVAMYDDMYFHQQLKLIDSRPDIK